MLRQAEPEPVEERPRAPAVRPPAFRDWRQTPEGQQYAQEREQREAAQRVASPRQQPVRAPPADDDDNDLWHGYTPSTGSEWTRVERGRGRGPSNPPRAPTFDYYRPAARGHGKGPMDPVADASERK
eukprot:7881036-Alexandrium_andersonii.AAC.1